MRQAIGVVVLSSVATGLGGVYKGARFKGPGVHGWSTNLATLFCDRSAYLPTAYPPK
jgi:hypothetical protein